MNIYRYYQPNNKDLKDEAGDCQIRAISKVLNISWVEAFDLTVPICRELQTYTIFGSRNIKKVNAALEKLGFSYTGISVKKGCKRPTVKEFASSHKNGKYILRVSHHVVACVNGFYYDTWDSGSKSLYGYYELNKENECL